MRRLRKSTILSVILASLAISFVLLFIVTGNIIPLVLAFVLLIASGYARKRETYEEYRDRYEQRYGMESRETDPSDSVDEEG